MAACSRPAAVIAEGQPPGYKGQLPEGSYFIARPKTNRVAWFGRMFLADQKDPKPVVRISANVTGDFGNVTDLGLGAGLRG